VRQTIPFIRLAAFFIGVTFAICAARAEAPATAPADAKIGEIELTFTQRSPLSTRKELARRLSVKEAELGADYDLATRPFKAYVPPSYSPAVPHGVFVYLGYKDSVEWPVPWEPVLDKAHLIFIMPECHHGDQYPNQVPLWQVMGLAFDAVENVKRLYNVDTRRVYLMSFHEGSLQMSLGAADVFTGMLCVFDDTYFRKIAPRGYGPRLAKFLPPPGPLLQQAKRRPIALLHSTFEPHMSPRDVLDAMTSDGFNVMSQLAGTEDVHYPNLKPEWFEQNVLPFLDKTALSAPEAHAVVAPAPPKVAAAPATNPAGAPSPAGPAGNPEAERLLRLAKLYVQNGQPNLARPKLETILSAYPKDPSAVVAKQLLDQLPAAPEK
jgi:hypothetical protein